MSLSKRNLRKLHESSRQVRMELRHSAQMSCQTDALPNSNPPASSSHEQAELHYESRTGGKARRDCGDHTRQVPDSSIRPCSSSGTGLAGPTNEGQSVAFMLWQSPGSQSPCQSTRQLGALQDLQCSTQLHSSSRLSGSDNKGGERAPGAEDAQRVGDPFEVGASNVRTLSGHAEEDRCILTGGIQKHLESHASQVKPKAKAGYFKMAKSDSPTGSWEHVHNPEAERRS